MKLRLVLGTLLLAAMAGLFALDHALQTRSAVATLILLAGCLAWWEFARLAGVTARAKGGSPALFAVGLAGTAYFLALAGWGPLDPQRSAIPIVAGVVGTVFAGFAVTVFREDHKEAFVPLLATILGTLFCGLLLSYLARVYRYEHGTWLGIFFLLGVKGNDIVAYFVGTWIGRRRWIPVSPKKTVEGCLGALVFSLAWFTGGALLAPFPLFPWPVGALVGIIISIASVVGDLSESLVKRFYAAKDSGAFLPEFGGILDLVDSFLYCGFVFWLSLVL